MQNSNHQIGVMTIQSTISISPEYGGTDGVSIKVHIQLSKIKHHWLSYTLRTHQIGMLNKEVFISWEIITFSVGRPT